jgi:hypothetical protein
MPVQRFLRFTFIPFAAFNQKWYVYMLFAHLYIAFIQFSHEYC